MILCIDTAIDRCGVGLCQDGLMVDTIENETAFKASEILHKQIGQLLDRNQLQLKDLQAIAVNGGPGSYTGLRIGASAAKGFCYALNIPLIHIDGLQLMKAGIIERKGLRDFDYYIPMIDARRDEVFTTIINKADEILLVPQALILTNDSFQQYKDHSVLFFGNGAEKASGILDRGVHYAYIDFFTFVADFQFLAWEKWQNREFENNVTYVPNYLKKFHFIGKKAN